MVYSIKISTTTKTTDMEEQLISFETARFVIKDKFTNNYYEYTNNGQQIWTGKIETSKHFKYKIVAYVCSLFIDRNNTTVVNVEYKN